MPSRFQVREESIGGYCVWDNQARCVAVVDGSRATGLTRWEARQVAGWLNAETTHQSHSGREAESGEDRTEPRA